MDEPKKYNAQVFLEAAKKFVLATGHTVKVNVSGLKFYVAIRKDSITDERGYTTGFVTRPFVGVNLISGDKAEQMFRIAVDGGEE